MTHPNDRRISGFKSSEKVLPIHKNEQFEKIKPLSYKEIVLSQPSPLEIILHPWLPKQGLAIIYAEAGVGKTLFTLNVAYAIAAGCKFLTYAAPLPRKVLYIDGEMAYTQMHSRFMQIIKQQGALEEDNFFLFNGDMIEKPYRLPKICNIEGQEFYNKVINEYNAEVIVIDNLSALSVMDENDPSQWKVVQDWISYLKTQGKSIILVHHAGKDKKGYRGTSRILDILDTAISLQKLNQDQLENEKSDSTKFKIEYHKNRTFGGKDAYPIEVMLSVGGWDSQSLEKTNLIRIAESVNEGVRQFSIAKEMNVSGAYVSKMVKQARKLGMLTEKS